MWTHIRNRVLFSIVVLWAVSTVVFGLMRFTPGDPVAVMLQTSGGSAERIAELREQLGLDEPMLVQYQRFLTGAVRGDLGKSIFTGRPVVKMILEQFPSTLELAFAALVIGVVVGGGLGILSGLREGSWIDTTSMVFAATGVSMPSFWLGLILISVFAFWLGWLPATGQGGLQRLIMPAAVLGFGLAAVVARLVRSSLLEVMAQDYVITARSKGLTERVVVLRHALRNALIPVITMVGLEFGWLLGGAIIVETVFARRGLGRLAVQAVISNDFPLVQGAVLFAAVFYLSMNLVVDLLYIFLDPRIRTS